MQLNRPVERDAPQNDGFGWRRIGFHHGIDFGWRFAAPIRTRRVYASAAGRVVETGWNRLVGYYVVVEHTPRSRTRYAHFSTVAVRWGQAVAAGTYLGQMGNTGSQSTGVHLHFELWVDGVRVDPQPYLNGRDLPGSPPPKPDPKPEYYEEDFMRFLFTRDRNGAGTLWGLLNAATGKVQTTRDQAEANLWAEAWGPAKTVSVNAYIKAVNAIKE